jgi:hypothetical protein
VTLKDAWPRKMNQYHCLDELGFPGVAEGVNSMVGLECGTEKIFLPCSYAKHEMIYQAQVCTMEVGVLVQGLMMGPSRCQPNKKIAIILDP